MANGLMNWDLAEYSRVMYNNTSMKPKPGSAAYPKIEFMYDHDKFIGQLHFASFRMTNGKWYIRCTADDRGHLERWRNE